MGNTNHNIRNLKTIEFPNDPFWNFSIHYYSQEKVSDSLLYLQNQYNLDVNLMLLSIWAGCDNGMCINKDQFSTLDITANKLQRIVISPLRKIRGDLKPLNKKNTDELEYLRNSIKDLELFAEHVVQINLSHQLGSFTDILVTKDHKTAAELNLMTYFDYGNMKPTQILFEQKDILIRHARKKMT